MRRLTVMLTGGYMALCLASTYVTSLPGFIYDWKLFVVWSQPERSFLDISYEQDGFVRYASRHAREHADRGFDVISSFHRLFAGDTESVPRIAAQFRERCACANVRVVRIYGSPGEHVFYDRRERVEVVFDAHN